MLFTGKERDAETGLDYFGARYFSGAQGRFTSPDVPFADQFVGDPQSWNLYAYTRNNPLRYIDDDGRGAKEFFFGVFNATWTNALGGLGRARNSDTSVRSGQRVGDVVSMLGGLIEMAAGGTSAAGGAAACSTGLLCAAGAPAVVGGVALAGHGSAEFGTAASNFFLSCGFRAMKIIIPS